MKTAAQLIDALMEIHPKGFDLSLDRIKGLLARLGDPHLKLPPIIHVAGTNGKGSTVAFTRAILEAAGLAVHVDTSPHLVNWHERFRIGRKDGPGRLVEDAVLADAIDRVAQANGGQPITVFEILTAAMFVLFSEHPADVCLIEVGLGGRFDCTNVMDEVAVSVITPVSMDHEAFLGNTLAKIAFEKAGIIKRKCPVIVGAQRDEALATIEQQAAKQAAPVQIFGEHFTTMEENGRLLFQHETGLMDLPLPSLPGDHQIENAGVALAAVAELSKRTGLEVPDTAYEIGIASAHWPGRLQALPKGALWELASEECDIWLDGGHNPGAAAMIARFMAGLEERDPRPLIMVCGMLNTKDPAGYFEQFVSLAEHVITVPILSSDAGIPPAQLAGHAQAAGLKAHAEQSLEEALQHIEGTEGPRILICGSLYLVGDALDKNGTPPQ